MSSYLIYHPKRCVSTLGDLKVYHDSTSGNQDPYVWNKQFLHTYCHMPLRSAENSINFWVSGDTFLLFSHLYCDLIFVVQRRLYWQQRDAIGRDDSLVDSEEAFIDHYQWMHQHPLNRRRRYTLKADPDRSFQPQNARKELIDIVPFLNNAGLPLEHLRQVLQANVGTKPFRIDGMEVSLYEWLDQRAPIKLKGETLQEIRQKNPQLSSELSKNKCMEC